MSARRIIASAASLAVLAGCTAHGSVMRDQKWGTRPAPVVVAEVPVKGFDVSVSGDDDTVSGELLAVGACFVHVRKDSRTIAVPSATVESVSVQLYSGSTASGIAALSFFGTLSTLSHGWFLVFSVPIWLTSGIATSVSLANADDVKVETGSLLFQFARFPQGLPPGWQVDRIMPGATPACVAPPAPPPALVPAPP